MSQENCESFLFNRCRKAALFMMTSTLSFEIRWPSVSVSRFTVAPVRSILENASVDTSFRPWVTKSDAYTEHTPVATAGVDRGGEWGRGLGQVGRCMPPPAEPLGLLPMESEHSMLLELFIFNSRWKSKFLDKA